MAGVLQETMAKAVEMYRENATYAQIARACGLSKNQVAGMIDRNRDLFPRRVKEVKPRKKRVQTVARRPPQALPPDEVGDPEVGVALWQLEDGRCTAIISGVGVSARYCGQPVTKIVTGSYQFCQEHAKNYLLLSAKQLEKINGK